MQFDPDLFADELAHEDERATRTATATVPVVRQSARVTPRAKTGPKDYLTRPPEAWDWNDLRNYVAGRITELHGDFPRDERKEFGIFSRFAKTFGERAGAIAVFAFETQPQPGFWGRAPISTTRFCKGSDPYFAEPILARLDQA